MLVERFRVTKKPGENPRRMFQEKTCVIVAVYRVSV